MTLMIFIRRKPDYSEPLEKIESRVIQDLEKFGHVKKAGPGFLVNLPEGSDHATITQFLSQRYGGYCDLSIVVNTERPELG